MRCTVSFIRWERISWEGKTENSIFGAAVDVVSVQAVTIERWFEEINDSLHQGAQVRGGRARIPPHHRESHFFVENQCPGWLPTTTVEYAWHHFESTAIDLERTFPLAPGHEARGGNLRPSYPTPIFPHELNPVPVALRHSKNANPEKDAHVRKPSPPSPSKNANQNQNDFTPTP